MDERKSYRMKELQDVFFTASCGIGVFTKQTCKPLFLNNAYYRMVGYTPDEYASMISNSDTKLIYYEDLSITENIAEQFTKAEKISNERLRIVRKNGEICHVEICIIPLLVDEIMCALCIFDDTVLQKEQYFQFKKIANSIGSGICVTKVKSGKESILYVNDNFASLMGVKRECYFENPLVFEDLFTIEENCIKIHNAIKESRLTGRPQELPCCFPRPDSAPLWINYLLSAVPCDEDNSYLIVAITTDITEKKKSELVMAQKQNRYQLVVDEMNAAVFEWDLQSGTFYCSESYREYAMSEVSPDLILANKGPESVVHPDDNQVLQQFFRDTMSGVPRVNAVLRMKLTSGDYRWCKLIGVLYRDQSEQPVRTLGMIININEEREKSFILSSLLNELPGGVAVFRIGKNLECTYYNDGFARLTNRTRAELDAVLQNDQLLEKTVMPADMERFAREIKTNTVQGEQINISFRFFTKQGEVNWLHMNAYKLREENDCPVYYCIFTRPSNEATLYRSVVEDSAIGVCIAERKNRHIIYKNKAISTIFYASDGEPLNSQALFNVIFNDDDIAELPTDHYSEFQWQYGSRYYNVRARALIWNGIDSYIMYFSDETKELLKFFENVTCC